MKNKSVSRHATLAATEGVHGGKAAVSGQKTTFFGEAIFTPKTTVEA